MDYMGNSFVGLIAHERIEQAREDARIARLCGKDLRREGFARRAARSVVAAASALGSLASIAAVRA